MKDLHVVCEMFFNISKYHEENFMFVSRNNIVH